MYCLNDDEELRDLRMICYILPLCLLFSALATQATDPPDAEVCGTVQEYFRKVESSKEKRRINGVDLPVSFTVRLGEDTAIDFLIVEPGKESLRFPDDIVLPPPPAPYYLAQTELSLQQAALIWNSGAEVRQVIRDFYEEDGPGFQLDRIGWPSYLENHQNPFLIRGASDAVTIAARLSARTGLIVRLPTPTEWTYAFRDGKETAYWWGNEWDAAQAGLGGQREIQPVSEAEVGPSGFRGLISNVAECAEMGDGERSELRRQLRRRAEAANEDPIERDLYAGTEGIWGTGFTHVGGSVFRSEVQVKLRLVRPQSWVAMQFADFSIHDPVGIRLVVELPCLQDE